MLNIALMFVLKLRCGSAVYPYILFYYLIFKQDLTIRCLASDCKCKKNLHILQSKICKNILY